MKFRVLSVIFQIRPETSSFNFYSIFPYYFPSKLLHIWSSNKHKSERRKRNRENKINVGHNEIPTARESRGATIGLSPHTQYDGRFDARTLQLRVSNSPSSVDSYFPSHPLLGLGWLIFTVSSISTHVTRRCPTPHHSLLDVYPVPCLFRSACVRTTG